MQGQEANRIKFDDRDYRVICVCCGTKFEATRSDASFCSARCRVRWSRRPAQRLNAIETVQSMRVQLHQMRKVYGADAGFETALCELAGAVDAFIYHIELERK